MMFESCLFNNSSSSIHSIDIRLPQFYCIRCVQLTWLALNVFMFLQRLIYGLDTFHLLYCYYYIPIISQYSQVAVVYFRRCIIIIITFCMHKTGSMNRFLRCFQIRKEKLFVHISTLFFFTLPFSLAQSLAMHLLRYERYHIKVFICQSIWVRTH